MAPLPETCPHCGCAEAAAILGSVLRTSTQRGANPIEVLMAIATSDGRRNGLDLEPGPGS